MCKTGKPQRGTRPRPSAHPWAFFSECLVVDEVRALTYICMLRYWVWDAVPNWLLYSSVLDMGRCAELVTVFFNIGCGTLCRAGYCILQYWVWDAVPSWLLYSSILGVGRCAELVAVFFSIGYGTLCRYSHTSPIQDRT